MKNTIIQNAINTLTAQVELMECTGAINWHERYLQAVKERNSWTQRFTGLEADMRGMETMLSDERAAVKRLTDKCTYLSAESAARMNAIDHLHAEIGMLETNQCGDALQSQLDLKTRAAKHLGKLHDQHVDLIEKQEAEIARLRAVLAVVQSACKG